MASSIPSSNPYSLSSRGQKLLESPYPIYLTAHFEKLFSQPMYNMDTHKDGYIALSVAENRLMEDLLLPKLEASLHVNPSDLYYGPMNGAPYFLRALATFMSKYIFHNDNLQVLPQHLAVVTGCGTIIETLLMSICDPSEAVLIPAPYYSGFEKDTERFGVHIVTTNTSVERDFRVTPEDLEVAWISNQQLSQDQRKNIRALLITSPSNPTGYVLQPDEIRDIVGWARSKQIHIIFDEIYALSIFDFRKVNTDLKQQQAVFKSVAHCLQNIDTDIHILWGFSKDFCISGYRVGVIYTQNKAIIDSFQLQGYWTCVSANTQRTLTSILSDDSFLTTYIDQLQTRLARSYHTALRFLEANQIPVLPSYSGHFFCLDLRAYLSCFPSTDDNSSFLQEELLWKHILDTANLNLSPGVSFKFPVPGFFRVCFSSVSLDTLEEAMRRLVESLSILRQQ